MSSIPDRQFFVHAAHTDIGITSAVWQPAPGPAVAPPTSKPETRPQLSLVSGCPSHQSDQSLSALARFIEQHYEVACKKAFARTRTDLPGLEELEKCDTVVLFAQRLAIDGPQLEQLREYFAAGRSVVALIPPGATFLNWPDWESEVLGIRSAGRAYGAPGAMIETAPYADGHPVLRDVAAIRRPGCVTTLPDVDAQTTVLLTARVGDRHEPVAWIRSQGQTRSFFTTLGQPTDFQQPAFLQLLANAALWTIGNLADKS
jgi:hypothetical protein